MTLAGGMYERGTWKLVPAPDRPPPATPAVKDADADSFSPSAVISRPPARLDDEAQLRVRRIRTHGRLVGDSHGPLPVAHRRQRSRNRSRRRAARARGSRRRGRRRHPAASSSGRGRRVVGDELGVGVGVGDEVLGGGVGGQLRRRPRPRPGSPRRRRAPTGRRRSSGAPGSSVAVAQSRRRRSAGRSSSTSAPSAEAALRSAVEDRGVGAVGDEHADLAAGEASRGRWRRCSAPATAAGR